MVPLGDFLLPRRDRPPALQFAAQVHVDGFGSVRVAVMASANGAYALRLPPDPPVPVRFLHRKPARLEQPPAATEHGVVVAVAEPRAGVRADRLDFLVDGFKEQRREFVRVPAIVPVSLGSLLTAIENLDGWTVDVSGNGVLLGGVEELLPGDRVRLQLALPAEQGALEAEAAVVRATPEGLRALRLDRLEPRDRERIVAFITARQRELLRVARGEASRR